MHPTSKPPALTLAVGLAVGLLCGPALAQPSAAEIARLGADLTPLGAERAGNAEGTIPPWEGGITEPPPGYRPGMHHPDPYSDDAVLFTITGENMHQHADRLSAGHQAMLAAYPTFRLPIYPTRRSGAVPQRIYDATREAAATARLVDGGNGVAGATAGIPFPIPADGQQVIWNHLLRYRGDAVKRVIGQAAPTRGGGYSMVKFEDEVYFVYNQPGMTEAGLNNRILLFQQEVVAPARLAGSILLVHETLNQVREHRSAWIYNPGQRRVRRAPNVAHDNPGTASDGMRTNDQFDMFNGSLERYDWNLLGKREMYVPYNAYRLHSDGLRHDELITPLHVNPEHLRYELHRVWVVDATVKDGARHLYKRRTFYVDEDTWQILLVDIYDNRDELWRVSEGHVINYYEMPLVWTTLEVHTDLQAGRYIAIGFNNEYEMNDFQVRRALEDYTPEALRRAGRR
jgi:hypothetical protein